MPVFREASDLKLLLGEARGQCSRASPHRRTRRPLLHRRTYRSEKATQEAQPTPWPSLVTDDRCRVSLQRYGTLPFFHPRRLTMATRFGALADSGDRRERVAPTLPRTRSRIASTRTSGVQMPIGVPKVRWKPPSAGSAKFDFRCKALMHGVFPPPLLSGGLQGPGRDAG